MGGKCSTRKHNLHERACTAAGATATLLLQEAQLQERCANDELWSKVKETMISNEETGESLFMVEHYDGGGMQKTCDWVMEFADDAALTEQRCNEEGARNFDINGFMLPTEKKAKAADSCPRACDQTCKAVADKDIGMQRRKAKAALIEVVDNRQCSIETCEKLELHLMQALGELGHQESDVNAADHASTLLDMNEGDRQSIVHQFYQCHPHLPSKLALQTNEAWTDTNIKGLCQWENKGKPCVGEENPGVRQGDMRIDDIKQRTSLIDAIKKGKRAVDDLWEVGASGKHEINWCFSQTASPITQQVWRQAIERTESEVPCLHFIEQNVEEGRNDFQNAEQENCAQHRSELGSLLIQSTDTGVWSSLGRVSGRGQYADYSQPINIGSFAEDVGIIQHELGHALGLLHELARSDRDQYITIIPENIIPDMEFNFDTDPEAHEGSHFDYLSLMMYGAFTFSRNGEITVDPRDRYLVSVMGQRLGFSQLDLELLGNIYNCPNVHLTHTGLTSEQSEAYATGNYQIDFQGKCVDAINTGYQRQGEESTGNFLSCSELRKYCIDVNHRVHVLELCPVSCGLCNPDPNSEEVHDADLMGTADNIDKNTSIRSCFISSGILFMTLASLLAGL